MITGSLMFRVVKQCILKGVDDNDSPENILMNIKPSPEWGIE